MGLRAKTKSIFYMHPKELFSLVAREVLNRGYTGLNELDKKIIAHIVPQRSGYFVELGANDGIRQSNTYRLQKRYGWTGLLIEPSPLKFSQCVQNRAFGNAPDIKCAACVPFEFQDKFVEMEYSDLMSVAIGLDLSREDASQQVERGLPFLASPLYRHYFGAPARTLTSLLDEVGAPANFDLLSLDVEGNELAVLRGLDLIRYRPRWILAECRDDCVPIYLQAADYRQREVLSDCGTYRDILFRAT